jgi:hypothetical protein
MNLLYLILILPSAQPQPQPPCMFVFAHTHLSDGPARQGNARWVRCPFRSPLAPLHVHLQVQQRMLVLTHAQPAPLRRAETRRRHDCETQGDE